jgi:hypothetical protein
MRIKVTKEPASSCIDRTQLGLFRPGLQYDVGTALAGLIIAEGWAEAVSSDEPAVIILLKELDVAAPNPPLSREMYALYDEGSPVVAFDRRRHSRSRAS